MLALVIEFVFGWKVYESETADVNRHTFSKLENASDTAVRPRRREGKRGDRGDSAKMTV